MFFIQCSFVFPAKFHESKYTSFPTAIFDILSVNEALTSYWAIRHVDDARTDDKREGQNKKVMIVFLALVKRTYKSTQSQRKFAKPENMNLRTD